MRTCKSGNSYPAANKEFSVVHDATKRGGTHETGSGWHADRVLDFLNDRKSAKDEKPFFIYFGAWNPIGRLASRDWQGAARRFRCAETSLPRRPCRPENLRSGV